MVIGPGAQSLYCSWCEVKILQYGPVLTTGHGIRENDVLVVAPGCRDASFSVCSRPFVRRDGPGAIELVGSEAVASDHLRATS
jgi:hypothetical protein